MQVETAEMRFCDFRNTLYKNIFCRGLLHAAVWQLQFPA